MRHIHSCQDCILRGHNLSGPRVLMNETDRVVDGEQEITSLKAQNLWCQTRVCVRIPLPTGSAAERKAATNCLNELKSNTKQEEKEEARAHLDLRSTMVVASSTSPPSVPSTPRRIVRHRPSSPVMHPANVFHFGYKDSGISYKLFRHFWRPKIFTKKSQS